MSQVSTRRHNPFDLSHDSDYGLGLPPIPGSAPSALHPRHNPFDLPYDSSEEKSDLRGDGFQKEFIEFSHVQKEPVFRRNETFIIGSSSMEFPRYEVRDTSRSSQFRPYFVTEGTAGEGTSYSFQRLPSDEYFIVGTGNSLALNSCIQEEQIVPARYRQEFLTIAWEQSQHQPLLMETR